MTELCDVGRSALVLVDLQARLMPAIDGGEAVVRRATVLARAARLLDVPVLGTEQNPEGLGPNLPEVRALCDATVAKTHFAASAAPGLGERLPAGRDELIVAGCEAHVCVLQTVLGLLAQGHRVRLVADAVGSRRAGDRALALERARGAGATVVSSEMVIFEWLRHCRHPAFRDALKLVK